MAGFLVPRRSKMIRWQGTLDALLPQEHPARFVWETLSSLDFAAFKCLYRSVPGGPGRPPYHPRLLCALWIYGMIQGLETAVGIAAACRLRDDFRWLAGELSPSDQTLLNFIDRAKVALPSVWTQTIDAMHAAGHVDLSVIAEDGTKLRANASPRSFLTAKEIETEAERLESRLTEALQRVAENADDRGRGQREVRALRQRLKRAHQAASELRDRAQRRSGLPTSGTDTTAPPAPPAPTTGTNAATAKKFVSADFEHDGERDVMLCPADRELRFMGEYPTDNGRGTYRLFGRRDCGDCRMKAQCTSGRGRRVKVRVRPEPPSPLSPGFPSTDKPNACTETVADEPHAAPGGQTAGAQAGSGSGGNDTNKGGKHTGPRASLTDPEALMMLATSQKRWEPSYNADLAVTRDGVIVSQFLTKNPTDFHNFSPALRNVIEAVGRPESWVGDGHYGTHANLVLAAEEGVLLYAPPAGKKQSTSTTAEDPEPAANPNEGNDAPSPEPSSEKPRPERISSAVSRFTRADFRHVPDRDVMVCPGDYELRLIGRYDYGGRSPFRLYGRSDCTGCELRAQCTKSKGRRLKIPEHRAFAPTSSSPTKPASQMASHQAAVHGDDAEDVADIRQLLDELGARMRDHGDAMARLRRSTVEPVNNQLKQHGLRRFHVRGLRRCSAVLGLGCLAHNMMKWRGREAAKTTQLAA